MTTTPASLPPPRPSRRNLHPNLRRNRPPLPAGALALLLLLLAATGIAPAAQAGDTSAAAQLQRWSAEAGAPGQAERGRLFVTRAHGGEWSCASCHGNPPTGEGRHAATAKTIAPLAPAANPRAFTDGARTDKWFRRNCKDVLSRECSPQEKADVLAYLVALPVRP